MIRPVYTEKSLSLAKNGKYSFWVGTGMTKTQIKSEIADLFDVHVQEIKTVTTHSENKRNMRGVKFVKKGNKKAIVTLKGDEKIDVFEESKK